MAVPITVISQFQVGPAPDDNRVSRMALRLSYFDMLWLHAPPAQRLLYYRIPGITQTQFLNDVVSKFRWSLSETFRNYLPMAGTLTIPKNSDPEILWVDGDSVALTAVESAADFDSLTADHAINCSDLHHLVPELQSTVTDSGSTVSDLIAVQITLFSEKGFSIGITNHAAAGDGNTMYRFMRIWSMNARGEGKPETMEVHSYGKVEFEKVEFFRATKLLPFYYRNIIEDPEGIAKTYRKQWDEILKNNLQSGISSNTSSTKLRRTFSLSFNHVKSLKALYPSRSTFQVACAYAWSCLVKSRQEEEEEDDEFSENSENRESRLVCFADCRTRVHCMADWNYFGNCLAVCLAAGRHSELVKEGAVGYGAGLIRSVFEPRMNVESHFNLVIDGGTIRAGAKEWLVNLRSVDLEEKDEMVANSSGFNFYRMRFCWGRPVRFEFVSIDKMGAFSLCGTRFYRFGAAKGGDRPKVEVCVCLPNERMDAFAAAFHEGLKDLPVPAEPVEPNAEIDEPDAEPVDEPVEPNAEIDEPDAEPVDEPDAEIDLKMGELVI